MLERSGPPRASDVTIAESVADLQFRLTMDYALHT
jgi:hypothetical protein